MAEQKILTPIRAIRAYCVECSGGSFQEVKLCAVGSRCPLYPYRLGHRPQQEPEPVEDMEGDTDE